VVTLPLRPQVLRPGPLAQRLQHRGQRRGALRAQVPAQLPGAAERRGQAQAPVVEPVIAVGVGAGGGLADLVEQVLQVPPLRAAGGRVQQDLIGAIAVLGGQQLGPLADLPAPRLRDPRPGQGLGHGGVRGQAPHPPDRPGRGAAGDPGLPPQPGPRRALPVVFVPALRVERAQHPGPRRRVQRLRPLQRAQRVRLLAGGQRRRVRARQPAQRGLRHGHRLSGGGGRGGRGGRLAS
jgi:hypothetical protein